MPRLRQYPQAPRYSLAQYEAAINAMLAAAARHPPTEALRSAEREFLALADELINGAAAVGDVVEVRLPAFRKLCAWRDDRFLKPRRGTKRNIVPGAQRCTPPQCEARR